MAKKKEVKYLLELAYPGCSFAIGLFDTEAGALAFAGMNPPPPMNELPYGGGPLTEAFIAQVWGVDNCGMKENDAPKGYVLQRFENGKVTCWAAIAPYDDRVTVYPKPPAPPKDTAIDPEQELNWN